MLISLWVIILLGLALLGIAAIGGIIWFVWAIFTGRIDLMGPGYEDRQREAKAGVKADLKEVNDPTVWLPEFAQKSKIFVSLDSGGKNSGRKIRIKTVLKSQGQLDEEKRVYFEAKEKRL